MTCTVIGYGYHGDFIAAWDEGVLQQAVEQCTDMGGEMRSCGVFEFPDNTASCTLENLPSELKDENAEGPMQGLPGGCEVQSGPEQAKKGKGATGSSSGGKAGSGSSNAGNAGSDAPPAPVPAPSSSTSSVPVEAKQSGGVFAQVKNEAPAADYQAPPSPTTTTPPAGPSSMDQVEGFVSTVIYTDGRIVHENKIVVQEVTVTTDVGAKAKRTPEAHAGHAKRGHRHHHHAMQHGIGGRRLR